MIHTIKYICSSDGVEYTSSNIYFDTKIGYSLREGDYSIEGNINTKTTIIVNCICGKNHEFLLDAKNILI